LWPHQRVVLGCGGRVSPAARIRRWHAGRNRVAHLIRPQSCRGHQYEPLLSASCSQRTQQLLPRGQTLEVMRKQIDICSYLAGSRRSIQIGPPFDTEGRKNQIRFSVSVGSIWQWRLPAPRQTIKPSHQRLLARVMVTWCDDDWCSSASVSECQSSIG
jgi:hypothetical protein